MEAGLPEDALGTAPPTARKGMNLDPDYVTLARLGMPPEEWESYEGLRESRRYTPAHYYNRSVGGLGPLVAGWIMTMGGLVLGGIGGVFFLKAPPDPGDNCDDVWDDCWNQAFTRSFYLTEGTTFALLGTGLAIGGIVLIAKGERSNERWIDRDSDLEGASDADWDRYRRQGPWPPPDESNSGPSLIVTPMAMPDGAGAGAIWTF